MRFDLAIVGGTLVDRATNTSRRADVGVRNGRVAAIDASIPRESAQRVLDATGCYVVPGFVDLHTHIFSGSTYCGLEHADLAWHSGVTTWVDAGSAGAYNFAGLRRHVIDTSPFRVRAFLNVASIGLTGRSPELWHPDCWDVQACTEVVRANVGTIVGIKVRADHHAGLEQDLAPVRAALEVAGRCGLPVMAHIGTAPPSVDTVLDLLRAGDVVTHCFTPGSMQLVDDNGRLRPRASEARERGVLFDVGHGIGGFGFSVAEQLIANGFLPDVISTDAHRFSIGDPMVDLPTCLTKLLGMGMSFDAVIAAATARPAAAIGIEQDAGSLAIGRQADMAVIARTSGQFVLVDSSGAERTMRERIAVVATVLAGNTSPPLAEGTPNTKYIHELRPPAERLREGGTGALALSTEQIGTYRRDGYLKVDGVIEPGLLEALRKATEEMVALSSSVDRSDSVFDFAHTGEARTLRRIKAPERHGAAFADTLTSKAVLSCVEALIGADIRFWASKLNLKQPGGGQAVEWHQDWAFGPATNDDILTVGIPLDDATLENGCLLVSPGSHCGRVLDHWRGDRFCGIVTDANFDASGAVPLEVLAGGISIHHIRTLHASAANHSSKQRRLLLYTYAAADAWPLSGVADRVAFDSQMLQGDPVAAPRLESVPVPPWPRWQEEALGAETSIFDFQDRAGTSRFS